ncbi:Lipopolysaccharide-modifying protein [Penicillium capsulatum]|nr:Lipopolysaccharide-modifying protein [Penicillium capsulatum]
MTELQAEHAGQPASTSSDASLGSHSAAGSIDWRDTLTWDLTGVLQLRRLLALWAEYKVPASDMGLFLVKVLYERDGHLGNRLMRMVYCNESYTNIALDIMRHYQVRGSDGQPLWMALDLGEVELRPSGMSSFASSGLTIATGYTESMTAQGSFHGTNPSPVDLPPRWPFYMRGADLEDFFLNSPETSGEEFRCRPSSISLRSAINPTKLQIMGANSDPPHEPMTGDMAGTDQGDPSPSDHRGPSETPYALRPGFTPTEKN